MIEAYKFKQGLTPPIMDDIFLIRDNNYNLRNFREIYACSKSTVKYGTEALSYKVPQLWQIVSQVLKEIPTLITFKNKTKQ